MNSRFAYLRERLRTSLWPIPAALCLAGGVTAVLMLWLDTRFQITVDDSPWSALGNDTVQRVIAVIAGSIIGVGGVAFSITMVALTLTSGQYGPKILRNFLEDRTSKVTLGLFLGSYAYSLITLSGFTLVETPRFSLLGALASAFAALFAFVQFMHRTATDLQADQIVQRIGRQLHHTLSDMADVKHGPRRSDDTAHWRRATRGCRRFELAATQHGYVQAIDYQGLSRLCAKHDCTLMVRARAGDFLIGDDYPPGHDLISFITPLQGYMPDAVIQVFGNAFAALEPGGEILVIDYMLENDKTGPLDPALVSLFSVRGGRPRGGGRRG